MFAVALGIAGALAPAPALAAERTFTAGPMVGVRLFEDALDLQSELSFGARIGMGFSERWGVVFDFVAAHPLRESTGGEVVIDALRALAKANILTGKARPYLVAGLGGGMFLFPDAPNSAHGTMTAGAGFEYHAADRVLIMAEGSMDYFRAQPVIYYPNGAVVTLGPRETFTMGTISLGLAVEF
jgi:hypothetical protein